MERKAVFFLRGSPEEEFGPKEQKVERKFQTPIMRKTWDASLDYTPGNQHGTLNDH